LASLVFQKIFFRLFLSEFFNIYDFSQQPPGSVSTGYYASDLLNNPTFLEELRALIPVAFYQFPDILTLKVSSLVLVHSFLPSFIFFFFFFFGKKRMIQVFLRVDFGLDLLQSIISNFPDVVSEVILFALYSPLKEILNISSKYFCFQYISTLIALFRSQPDSVKKKIGSPSHPILFPVF